MSQAGANNWQTIWLRMEIEKNIFTDWFENMLKAVYQMLFTEGHMNVKMLNKVFNGLICDNIFCL